MAERNNTQVFIGVGKEGLAPSITPHVMEVDANLMYNQLKGLSLKNFSIHFDYLPQENHATIAHQALINATKLIY